MRLFRWHMRDVNLLLALTLLSLPLANLSTAQDTTVQDTATEATEEQTPETIDPYKVPAGDVDELLAFMQEGPGKMQPRTAADARRMFQSLDSAAEQVFTSDQATLDQRREMIRARSMFLRRLGLLGEVEAGERLKKFLNRAASDPAPELQTVARKAILDMKISNWGELQPGERDAVVTEIREGVTGEERSGESVVALMKLADAVSETPEAPAIVELIQEVLPQLADASDPKIAKRVPRLEGLVRRLQLPGNEIELEGVFLDGEQLDWASYRGKVVLVDYWATWCGPCLAELPNMRAAFENYHDKGFEILAISLDDQREDVENFLGARELPWQTLFSDDESSTGWEHPMASKYAINAIPRAILVDQEGKVVSMNLRGPMLEKALADLLGPVGNAASAIESNTTAQSQP